MQKTDLASLNGPQLVAFWNGLPGVTPVKKFTTAAIGRARIEKQLANSPDPVPEPETEEEPVLAKAKRPVKAKTKTPAALTPTKQIVFEMLKRGASLAALAKKLNWDPKTGANSVCGMLSTMRNKDGIAIVNEKKEDGQRVYRLAS